MSDAKPWIPPDLYDHLTKAQSADQVIGAIKAFLDNGDEVTFEYAVAVYLAAARFREEPIERVLQVLTSLGESIEGLVASPPSRLSALIFRGILKAFYGEVTVEPQRGPGGSEHVPRPE